MRSSLPAYHSIPCLLADMSTGFCRLTEGHCGQEQMDSISPKVGPSCSGNFDRQSATDSRYLTLSSALGVPQRTGCSSPAPKPDLL